jgi:CBS domain containing-hemolysin-like protein
MARDNGSSDDFAPIATFVVPEEGGGRALLRSGVEAARQAGRNAADAAQSAGQKAGAAAGSTVQSAALVFGQVVGAGIFVIFGSFFVLLAVFSAIAPRHGEALAALVVAMLALILAFTVVIVYRARPAPVAAPNPLGLGAMTVLPMLFSRSRRAPVRSLVARPRRGFLRPRTVMIGLLLTALASEALHRTQSDQAAP